MISATTVTPPMQPMLIQRTVAGNVTDDECVEGVEANHTSENSTDQKT